MILLALIVVVAVLILVFSRRATGDHATSPSASRSKPGALEAALHRAAAAGIITVEQADAVLEAERGAGPVPSEAVPARVPPVLEAIAYLGSVLVMAGAAVLVAQYWDEMGAAGRLSLVGVVATVLTGAALLIRDERDPVFWRLRGFVGLLATAAVAGFVGLVFDTASVTDEPVAVGIGAAVAVHGVLLWWLRERPLQHLATLGGIVVALAGAGAWIAGGLGWEDTDTGIGVLGIAIWVLGALWLVGSLRDLLPPRLVGVVLGAVTVLAACGPINAGWERYGLLAGLATAGGLIGLGIALDEFLVTGVGVLGTFVYLPLTVAKFFGGTIGVPAVMVLSGIALLGVTLVLLQRRGEGPGLHGGWPGVAGHA